MKRFLPFILVALLAVPAFGWIINGSFNELLHTTLPEPNVATMIMYGWCWCLGAATSVFLLMIYLVCDTTITYYKGNKS